ncbi:hypothetical protein LR48_Vigan01g250700 [Vigna angularis]|uniref:Uncharacterized protein n=1 Tax=Phaseolus angularis TaxID=3914 RepID=A0A0L9TR51_PHAAN|nr:uncharacterized protein HKW66_Vig0028400 [Vigna angularis]KOM32951.1 hypothetical protein LR48_Vigan01g250700 [Vigna angularis]
MLSPALIRPLQDLELSDAASCGWGIHLGRNIVVVLETLKDTSWWEITILMGIAKTEQKPRSNVGAVDRGWRSRRCRQEAGGDFGYDPAMRTIEEVALAPERQASKVKGTMSISLKSSWDSSYSVLLRLLV